MLYPMMITIRLFCLFSMLLLALGCQDRSELSSFQARVVDRSAQISKPFGDLRDFPEIAQETDIDVLISGMVKGNCVFGRGVGQENVYRKEYACYERLTQLLGETAFFNLVKHRDPVVRVYGLKGLKEMRSTLALAASEILKQDSALVNTAIGCTFGEMRVQQVVDFGID